MVADEFLVTVAFDSVIKCIEQVTYGNGAECNMGNEMGGLVVSLFADLMYNDLSKLTSTGKADEAFLPNYLYCNHFSANIGNISAGTTA